MTTLGALPLLAISLLPGAPNQERSAPERPQVLSVSVAPDSMSIGTPFEIVVKVAAPPGATVLFPEAPHSSNAARLLDPVVVTVDSASKPLSHTATYRLAAWEIGTLPVELDDVVVTTNAGATRLVVGAVRFTVVSVLPSDSAERVPRPARDLFGSAPPWWYPWLPLLAMALALAAVFWWWWRRRQRTVAYVGAVFSAEKELEKLRSLRLIEAGERGRFVTLTADILRDFLCARFPELSRSHTSTELSARLRAAGSPYADRIEQLFMEADGAKFARTSVDDFMARSFADEVHRILRELGDRPPSVDAHDDVEVAA